MMAQFKKFHICFYCRSTSYRRSTSCFYFYHVNYNSIGFTSEEKIITYAAISLALVLILLSQLQLFCNVTSRKLYCFRK